MFGYSLNYLIDTEEAIFVDVEATPTRLSKEVDATGTMIERVHQRFALKPKRIAGDTAYGTGRLLGWLRHQNIEPHIPVWDRAKRRPGRVPADRHRAKPQAPGQAHRHTAATTNGRLNEQQKPKTGQERQPPRHRPVAATKSPLLAYV